MYIMWVSSPWRKPTPIPPMRLVGKREVEEGNIVERNTRNIRNPKAHQRARAATRRRSRRATVDIRSKDILTIDRGVTRRANRLQPILVITDPMRTRAAHIRVSMNHNFHTKMVTSISRNTQEIHMFTAEAISVTITRIIPSSRPIRSPPPAQLNSSKRTRN